VNTPIPFDTYAAIGAVNWSKLKHLWAGSPLHYKYHVDAGESEDTTGRAMGREVHRLVLEPDSAPDYVVWEGGDRRGPAWKEFEKAHAGRTIFKPNEVTAVYKQAAAIAAHPVAKKLLEGATFENTLEWTDPRTKLRCKGRTDAQKPGILIDLKGCGSVDPRLFAKEAAKNGYHLQLAHYCNGIATLTGNPPARAYIVAVETKAPYDVAVYRIGVEPLEQAQAELAYAMETLARCIRDNHWPGTCPGEADLAFPAYIYGDGGEVIISGGHQHGR
jgi:exodeoxyribonuclease VIII